MSSRYVTAGYVCVRMYIWTGQRVHGKKVTPDRFSFFFFFAQNKSYARLTIARVYENLSWRVDRKVTGNRVDAVSLTRLLSRRATIC